MLNHYDDEELDKRDEKILMALYELGGKVASKRQLHSYVRKKYREFAKNTFYKHLDKLIRKGYIVCSGNPRLGQECRFGEKSLHIVLRNQLRKIMPPMGETINELLKSHKISSNEIIVFLDWLYNNLLLDAILLAISSNAEDFIIQKYLFKYLSSDDISSYYDLLNKLQYMTIEQRTKIVEELLLFLKNYTKGWLKFYIKDKKTRKELLSQFERSFEYLEYIIKCRKSNGEIKLVEEGLYVFRPICVVKKHELL